MKRLLYTLLITTSIVCSQNNIVKKGNSYILENTVVVKVKQGNDSSPQSVVKAISENLKGIKITKADRIFAGIENVLNKGEGSLNRIIILELENNIEPVATAKKISLLKNIEWAEPKYVRKISIDLPNDSLYTFNQQAYLDRINAAEAWNTTTGDSNVVIAIVDSGVDWTHPDLEANIYTNSTVDPNYPNDLRGWDFGGMNGTPDNDPREDEASIFAYHGTLVAGLASAVTNNKIGIASIGYNCSLLPVKTSRNDRRDENGRPFIVYGFEGIKYAADRGAKVINCSWGGYGFSNYEKEIIEYAISKGSLVVAAAGNEGTTDLFYPASYDGVLTVGWLNLDDKKHTQANYGASIDVMAPGTSIIATWPTYSGITPAYFTASGSSLSSPLTAGLAGLVISKFPEYKPLQVAERIRATADYEITYNTNPSEEFKYKLGRGRINAGRALNETNVYSVRAVNVDFEEDGNGNGLLEFDECANIIMTFSNYLNDISSVKVTLECTDPAVSVIDSVYIISSLGTLQSESNKNGFRFYINPGGPYNHTVNLMLRFTAENYNDFQWISVRINPTYDNHNNNDLTFSVTSKGALGFNDYYDNIEGVGLRYKDQENVLFEGAFMYGTGQSNLMDAARISQTQSTDFNTITPVKISNIGSTQNQVGISVFNDDGAANSKLGIKTTMMTYSFTEPNNRNYIILRTKLENTSGTDIKNLFAGYYFDFDIPIDNPGYLDDMVDYDYDDHFGYAFDFDGSPQQTFIGAALISHDSHGFYAINQDSTALEVSPNSSDGFQDSEKWMAISRGISKTNAGPADISYVISGGPFDLNAGEKIDIAFTLACGENKEEIRSAIRQSRNKWPEIFTNIETEKDEIPGSFVLYQNYPNPFNPESVISYQLPGAEYVSLKIYDVLGNEIAVLVNEFKQAGAYNIKFSANNLKLTSGVYFYRLTAGNFSQTKKMIFLK